MLVLHLAHPGRGIARPSAFPCIFGAPSSGPCAIFIASALALPRERMVPRFWKRGNRIGENIDKIR